MFKERSSLKNQRICVSVRYGNTGGSFDDGNHIIYVNGSYDGDSPIGRLMHDFRSYKADEMYYSELANQVKFYKESEEGREIMCKIIEDYGDRRAKESEETTRIETKFNDIKNIMESLNLTLEQALSAIKISDADRAILMKRF